MVWTTWRSCSSRNRAGSMSLLLSEGIEVVWPPIPGFTDRMIAAEKLTAPMLNGMARPLTLTTKLCTRQALVPRGPNSSPIAEGMGLEPISPCGQRFSRHKVISQAGLPYPSRSARRPHSSGIHPSIECRPPSFYKGNGIRMENATPIEHPIGANQGRFSL